MKSPSVLRSFQFAFEGLAHAIKTQRNFKIQLVVAALVAVTGVALRISPIEWAVIAVAMAVVFQAELFNTALEAVVDHVAPEFQPLAKIAKDCAAGAVLVSALLSVVVGALIFLPKILSALRA